MKSINYDIKEFFDESETCILNYIFLKSYCEILIEKILGGK